MKNKAYSLHIGLDKVDPIHYRGEWEGKLHSCEADAEAMRNITYGMRYTEVKMLLSENATKAAFFEQVIYARNQLHAGDFFLLTFSGHGGQVLDTRGGDELDGMDETWCFYDGMVLDDQIHGLLQTFEKGVRILVVSDSCFSGTMLRDTDDAFMMWGESKRIDLPGVEASVRLLSSSQEHELSRAAGGYGLFTRALLKAWDNGNFKGNYKSFYDAIVCNIPFHIKQTPNHLTGGPVDKIFDESRPFEF